MRDVGPLTHLAERDDVFGAPADGAPVAARVLQQLVGLREPERPLASPEPLVEDDGGDLPSLAAAGAVAQHPAAPEAHRFGQRLVGVDGLAVIFGSCSGFIAVVIGVGVHAPHGLPAGADAVLGGKVTLVRLAGEDHALELGVGEQSPGQHLLRQHRAVGRHGVRHRRHGPRLHQRRRVLDRPRHVDARCPPPCVGAGGLGALGGTGAGRHRLVGKLGDRTPVVGLRLRPMRGGLGALRPRGPGRRGLAEEIGARHGLDGAPVRHGADDRLQQVAGVAHGVAGIDPGGLLPAPVEDREAGVEGGAAPCVGAPVDGRGEHRMGRRVEGGEGVFPRGVAGNAVLRRDRHEPPAGRQHREGRADVMQVHVMADAVDPGARREGRVHQDHGGAQFRQPVPDRLRVVAGDRAVRKQPGEKAGAGDGDLVEVQCARGPVAERKLRHHRQHAGAGRGFEHDVAGPDGGGLQRGVGERQRRRELLILELPLGAPGVRGFERRQGLQHAQHGGGTAGTGAGLAPHGAAVVLEEEHQRRLGGFVGILPEPGAVRVGGAEGGRHGLAQGAAIQRPAGFQDGQQDAGRDQQRGGRGGELRRNGFCDRGGGECGGGRRWGCGRRRVGVEHGWAPMTGCGEAGTGAEREGSPATLRPANPGSAIRAPRGGARWGGQAARWVSGRTPDLERGTPRERVRTGSAEALAPGREGPRVGGEGLVDRVVGGQVLVLGAELAVRGVVSTFRCSGRVGLV